MKKFSLLKFKFLFFLFTLISFIFGENALADNNVQPLFTCYRNGTCTICDILKFMVEIGKNILEFIGALALLIIIYAGFLLMVSHGKKGFDMLKAAIMGFLIVIFAYSGVVAILKIFTGDWDWQAKLTCSTTLPQPPEPEQPIPPPPPNQPTLDPQGKCKACAKIGDTNPRNSCGYCRCPFGPCPIEASYYSRIPMPTTDLGGNPLNWNAVKSVGCMYAAESSHPNPFNESPLCPNFPGN